MCLLLRVNYVETHVCRELLLPGWEETFTIKLVDCFELPNPFLSKNLLCQKWPISCLFFHNSSEYRITRYSLSKKLNYLLEHAIWFKWKVEKLISDYKTSRYMYQKKWKKNGEDKKDKKKPNKISKTDLWKTAKFEILTSKQNNFIKEILQNDDWKLGCCFEYLNLSGNFSWFLLYGKSDLMKKIFKSTY